MLQLFVAGASICMKVPIFEATVEAVGEDAGHRSYLLVDHARLDVEASTPGKAVELRKVLDECQQGSDLRVLLEGHAPREKRLGSSLKAVLHPQVKH